MAADREIADHSANDMFSEYKYLIVNLAFSRLGFLSGNFFLIAPFPDHCILVHFCFHSEWLNVIWRVTSKLFRFRLASVQCVQLYIRRNQLANNVF